MIETFSLKVYVARKQQSNIKENKTTHRCFIFYKTPYFKQTRNFKYVNNPCTLTLSVLECLDISALWLPVMSFLPIIGFGLLLFHNFSS